MTTDADRARNRLILFVAFFFALPVLAGIGCFLVPISCPQQSHEPANPRQPQKHQANATAAFSCPQEGERPATEKEKEGAKEPAGGDPSVRAWVYRWITDPISIFTYYIVLVTTGLAIYTGMLYGSTKKIASDAETAASNSVALTRATERAYIKFNHIPPGLKFEDGAVHMTGEIKNFGRTPGSITYSSLWYRLSDGGFPVLPEYGDTPEHNIPRAFLVTGEAFHFPTVTEIDSNAMRRILDGSAFLLAVGYIDYRDQFGGRYRSGYARRDDPAGSPSNLILFTQRGYNYDRERKNGEGEDWGEDAPA